MKKHTFLPLFSLIPLFRLTLHSAVCVVPDLSRLGPASPRRETDAHTQTEQILNSESASAHARAHTHAPVSHARSCKCTNEDKAE